MTRKGIFVLACSMLMLCTVSSRLRLQAALPQQSTPQTISQQRALLDKYCIACHSQRAKAAGLPSSVLLTLDNVDLARVGEHAEVLEKVVRKLRTGMMPPAGAQRPDDASNSNLASWLESQLDRAAASRPNAGRPALHRLNRNEYQNAIRDLLALDVDAESLLPADSSSYGFDNIAGSLVVSPVLLERYVSAAGKISRLAIGDTSLETSQTKYTVPPDLTQTDHIEGLPVGTRGGLLVRHNFPVDAEYKLKVTLLTRNAFLLVGSGRGEQLEISMDGARLKLFDLANYDPDPDVEIEKGFALEVRLPIPAGPHTIGAAFLKKNHAPVEDIVQPFEYSLVDPTYGGVSVVPHLSSIYVIGPYNATGRGDTPSRRSIFVCQPANATQEDACARKIVSTLAGRAFRRPSNAEDLEALMGFYQEGRSKGSFDDGIELALRRILASPEFVFRFERNPSNATPGKNYRISDLELASRLSFFLWSSIPDEALIDVAARGKLKDPVILEQQVRRMLADEKADALVKNFAGQWLYLRNLKNKGADFQEFPNFDNNLRIALWRETEMFFGSIMREDRNVLDLLTADYTFLDERLARHYGIPGVYGSQFRRVTLQEDARKGLLGKGAILMVTSYPNRTSPVQRGKWILENVLGAPAPTPPPNVPELEEKPAPGVKERSVRERMEEHRSNPVCAGCHKIMDPIGLSLENFDAEGRWRTMDAGKPIDSSGELLDGTRLDGPTSLRQALLRHSDQFVQTLTEKLFTYALGRGIEYYDLPTVRSIVRDSRKKEQRFTSLVMGIVNSEPFQMRAFEEATN